MERLNWVLIRASLCLVGLLLFQLTAPRSLAQAATPPAAPPATNPSSRFEKDVKTYEDADKKEMPPKNAILLVGDSQFFRWKTYKEDLLGYTVINRGIDSFQTPDLNYFFDRL